MATARCESRDNGKRAAVTALFAMSVLIVITGLAFGVYSWVFHVNYAVFGTEIPGFVFALFVVFLGSRYFMSVRKMNKTLTSTQRFSWNNFKSGKKAKQTEG